MAVYKQGVFLFRHILSTTNTIYRTETRSIKRWVSPTLRELKRRKDKLEAQAEIPRSSFLEWNRNAELYAFQSRLNEKFKRVLLERALTNHSYVLKEATKQQNAGFENVDLNIDDNRSLIRDGEEFIVKCVKEKLRKLLPKFPDDGVNAVCEYLVKNESLAHVASHIGLKDIILCSEYPPDENTLSTSLQALINALIQSSGPDRAAEFVYDFIVLRQIADKDVNEIWHIEQPMEMLSKLLKSKPEARLCNHSGGNTILAAYQVGLYNQDKVCVGLGWGESIEIAIEMAARDGLKRLFNTTDSMPALTTNHPQNADAIINQRATVHN